MQLPLYLRQLASARKSLFSQIQGQELSRIEEAMAMPDKSEWSFNVATAAHNAARNRYINVFPWNSTRVKLQVLADHSDYINASHIDLGPTSKFIASQGPLPTTVHHFWAMCYQQAELQQTDSIIVAMVTPLVENGITKCYKYWPDEENPVFDLSTMLERDGVVEQLIVKFDSKHYDNEGDFLITKITLLTPESTKTVHHFAYTKWVDSRVPPSAMPLVTLSQHIRLLQSTETHPPVPIVHCSAGVGRTGTYMMIDYLLQHFQTVIHPDKGTDPIQEVVKHLRTQRMMMVQTLHQYSFLYDTVKMLLEKSLTSPKRDRLH